MSYIIHRIPTFSVIPEYRTETYIYQVCIGRINYPRRVIIVVYWNRIRKWATRKVNAGCDLQENKKSGSRYNEISVERTHSQVTCPGWNSVPVSSGTAFLCLIRCFVLCPAVSTIILRNSWGARAPKKYPTCGVCGLHEPHRVRLPAPIPGC